jgi:hypothetical protein
MTNDSIYGLEFRERVRAICIEVSRALPATAAATKPSLAYSCKSAWQALKEMFGAVASNPAAQPGVVISVQSYGDSLHFHLHIHSIAARGVWSADGRFESIPALDTQQLMLLFRHRVLQTCSPPAESARPLSKSLTDFIIPVFRHTKAKAYRRKTAPRGNASPRIWFMLSFLSPAFITIGTPASSPMMRAPRTVLTWIPAPLNGSPRRTR